MNYKKLIVDSGKRMAGSGLTVETGGNISVRDSETGLSISEQRVQGFTIQSWKMML